MLYWGFGFLVLAATTLVMALVLSMPGTGMLANVAIIGALVFLTVGAARLGHHHYRLHLHRRQPRH